MIKKIEGWFLSSQIGRDMHSGTFVEAICPHGVGHHKGVHGCHMSDKSPGFGCCKDAPAELWEKVSAD